MRRLIKLFLKLSFSLLFTCYLISIVLKDLKRAIIDDGLVVIVNQIIIPHSGWGPNNLGDTCWSTVFRNTSGVLRYNIFCKFSPLLAYL